jgi:hypothetical protein
VDGGGGEALYRVWSRFGLFDEPFASFAAIGFDIVHCSLACFRSPFISFSLAAGRLVSVGNSSESFFPRSQSACEHLLEMNLTFASVGRWSPTEGALEFHGEVNRKREGIVTCAEQELFSVAARMRS